MKEVLKKLHDLQIEAFAKGVYSFDITARYTPEDSNYEYPAFICVYIYLKGDETDEDYLATNFYGWHKEYETDALLDEIRKFIGL